MSSVRFARSRSRSWEDGFGLGRLAIGRLRGLSLRRRFRSRKRRAICQIRRGAAGHAAEQNFNHLLEACEAFAASRGLEKLVAGVNTARVAAYRRMLARGFRSFTQGVAMLRSEDQGYNRPTSML